MGIMQFIEFFFFEEEVSRRRRFHFGPATKELLAKVARGCRSREIVFPAGHIFYRAQLGPASRPGLYRPEPHSAARMLPETGRSQEGRANPKGIACLYLATHEMTAVSEVRPWVGAPVTVAEVVLRDDIRLVDCTSAGPENSGPYDPLWSDINRAFAKPVTAQDGSAEYAPTQILAELFWDQGYEGVFFKSSTGSGGYNLALFGSPDVEVLNPRLWHVQSLTLTAEPLDKRIERINVENREGDEE